jgi:hypothetical protein
MKLSAAERELIVRLSDRGLVNSQYKDVFAFEERLNAQARDLAAREAAVAARERAVAGVPEPDVAAERAARLAALDAREEAVKTRERSVAVYELERREQRVVTEQTRLNEWETDLHSREFLLASRQARLQADTAMTLTRARMLVGGSST